MGVFSGGCEWYVTGRLRGRGSSVLPTFEVSSVGRGSSLQGRRTDPCRLFGCSFGTGGRRDSDVSPQAPGAAGLPGGWACAAHGSPCFLFGAVRLVHDSSCLDAYHEKETVHGGRRVTAVPIVPVSLRLLCRDPLVPTGFSQAPAELRSEKDTDPGSPQKCGAPPTKHAKVGGRRSRVPGIPRVSAPEPGVLRADPVRRSRLPLFLRPLGPGLGPSLLLLPGRLVVEQDPKGGLSVS